MCDNSSSITKSHSLGESCLIWDWTMRSLLSLDCDSALGSWCTFWYALLALCLTCLHTRMRRSLLHSVLIDHLILNPFWGCLFICNLACAALALLLFYSSLRVSFRGQAFSLHDAARRFFAEKLAVLTLQCCQSLGHCEKKGCDLRSHWIV